MKTAIPTAFPKPGTYMTARVHITLMSYSKDSTIHYTLDGSDPTEDSPIFNIEDGLLTFRLDDPSKQQEINIKAMAVKEGYENSDIASFTYIIASLPKKGYFYTILQEKQGTEPAVIRIEDHYQSKMYFVLGSERGLLIDAGFEKDNDLKSLLDTLADGLPYDAVISHPHLDHDAQAEALIEQGIDVYFNSEDLPTYERFGGGLTGYIDYREGKEFHLGDSTLKSYKVPGHTLAHMVYFDEKHGLLFSSDAFGNNRNTLIDTAFIHFGDEESTMDQYLSALQKFRYATNGKVKKIYFGHNDHVLGESFIDNLELAVQNVVDYGEAALSPSLRPPAECFGSSKVSRVGNYISDLDWIAVNTRILFSGDYNEENIASLSALFVKGGKLEPAFQPNVHHYSLVSDHQDKLEIAFIPSSTRVRSVSMNGVEAERNTFYPINEQKNVSIQITAPNGSDKLTYTIDIK